MVKNIGLFLGMIFIGTVATAAYFPTVEVSSSALPTGAATETTVATLLTDTQLRATPVAVSGTVTASNPSVGMTSVAVPTSSTLVGGVDGSGNLQSFTLDIANNLNVHVQDSVLPTGASTEIKQDTQIASLVNIETYTNNTAFSTAAINSDTSNINSKIPSNLTVTSTRLLVDGSGVTQPISGSVTVTQATGTNLHTVVDSSALPTGAATASGLTTINSTLGSPFQAGGSIGNTAFGISGTLPSFTTTQTFNLGTLNGAATAAKQPALGTAGSASADVITVQGIASMTALKVDGSAVTQPVSIAASVQTKAPLNTTGSGSAAAATVSTVTTLTAPANAVGFVLMNLDTSTANVRWAVGRTATTTLGQQLQPGRDTGVIPLGANVSLVAESGTQNYDIQWISQ